MVNSRKKGDNFERRVKKHLQDRGFFVVRQSASSFPDLIAISEKGVNFIECKVNKYISKDERAQLIDLQRFGDISICFNEKGKIKFCDLQYKQKTIYIS